MGKCSMLYEQKTLEPCNESNITFLLDIHEENRKWKAMQFLENIGLSPYTRTIGNGRLAICVNIPNLKSQGINKLISNFLTSTSTPVANSTCFESLTCCCNVGNLKDGSENGIASEQTKNKKITSNGIKPKNNSGFGKDIKSRWIKQIHKFFTKKIKKVGESGGSLVTIKRGSEEVIVHVCTQTNSLNGSLTLITDKERFPKGTSRDLFKDVAVPNFCTICCGPDYVLYSDCSTLVQESVGLASAMETESYEYPSDQSTLLNSTSTSFTCPNCKCTLRKSSQDFANTNELKFFKESEGYFEEGDKKTHYNMNMGVVLVKKSS